MAGETRKVDRQFIYEVLKTTGYDVFNIGQNYERSATPYIVLKALERQIDTYNRRGAYQYYEVQVYVPDTSVKLLDSVLDAIEEALSASIQSSMVNTNLGGDYHDIDINMYMRYIQFQIPIGLRGCL